MENLSIFATWGRWVAGKRTKWITLVMWVILTAVLSAVAPSVNKVESNNAAELPNASASVQAANLEQKMFPSQTGTPAILVWYRASGLTDADLNKVQDVAKALIANPIPGQKSVAPFNKIPLVALRQIESKDGTTMILPVSFKSSVDATTMKSSLATLQARVTKVTGKNLFRDTSITSNGLHARITGPAGIATDALNLFKHADVTLLASTTMLVLVLLILLYRSPVLAFVPLICVGLAYGVVSPLLGLLAKGGIIIVDAQSVSIMTVLLFGAGTDYCLFLVARYREYLYQLEDKHKAIRSAVGGAAGAIIMSGLTVVVSLLALIVSKYGSDHRFAIPFSLSILIMALAGVTLLPALLAIFGRRSFFPATPRTEEMYVKLEEARRQAGKRIGKRMARRHKTASEPGRVSRWTGRITSTHPWMVVLVSGIALVILAAFSTQMKFTYDLLQSFPSSMPSRQGYTLLAKHYSAGALAPVQVLVNSQGKDSQTVDTAVADSLGKLDFVKSVGTPSVSTVNSRYQSIQVTLKQDPYSMQSLREIPQIRQAAEQGLGKSGITNASSAVWVGGETATEYDTEQLTIHDTKLVIPIVIAIIALLLLLYLRSVTAMIYLIATVLLSYFSALGTGWLVLHNLMGASAVQGAIPLYAFVFLVALGEDYNIFMISRIWEARRHTNLRDAVYQGVSRTSGVITSAGLILAGTFAVLAGLPIQVLVQFGLLTSIGVLLDTFVVRPFLVPAITVILGRAAFWPGRLSTIPAGESGSGVGTVEKL